MSAVLKYVLEENGVHQIGLPIGAEILSTCIREDKVVIYAIADKESTDTDTYEFHVYGTGDEFEPETVTTDDFLGTVCRENSTVHVFFKAVETPIKDEVE